MVNHPPHGFCPHIPISIEYLVWITGEIVLNTQKDGEWGEEEKYGLPEAFFPGSQFHVVIDVRDEDYEVRALVWQYDHW